MQREVLDGVPYLVSKERNVYYYSVTSDASPIQLGSKSADGKLTLFANWKDVLASHLQSYRESSTTRSRKRS